ncbi:hypothetical protein Ac2012v2_001406 [Leucoagaricus gongylophorus]
MARSKVSTTRTKGKKSTVSSKKSDHPPWIQMIQECIVANPDDARIGVSRSQIKTFVESTYKFQFVQGHVTLLSRAIRSGAEKGIFSLPKGVSGRIKLASKVKAAKVTVVNEDKPTVQPKVAAKSQTAVAPKRPSQKAVTKPSPSGASSKVKEALKAKPATKPASNTKTITKKTSVTKAKSPAKKTTTTSKRGLVKKVAIGVTSTVNAKVAKATVARKTLPKRSAAKESSSKIVETKTTKKRS